MADIWHVMGNDLAVGANGDLLLADGSDETTQRVLRRLLTNPKAYLWHPDYGLGAGQYVGQLINVPALQGVIVQQMRQEAGVMQSPPPNVTVQADPTGFVQANISYTDALSGAIQVLSVPNA